MGKTLSLSPALEDYLEAISALSERDGMARVRDIAERLSVRQSSVTSALKSLSEKGMVNYSPYEVITLTDEGEDIAQGVRRRHRVIRDFLANILLIDDATADANACRMEHTIDKDVLRRLSRFAEFVRESPRTGEDWLLRFRYYFDHDGRLVSDDKAFTRWLGRLEEEPEPASDAASSEGAE